MAPMRLRRAETLGEVGEVVLRIVAPPSSAPSERRGSCSTRSHTLPQHFRPTGSRRQGLRCSVSHTDFEADLGKSSNVVWRGPRHPRQKADLQTTPWISHDRKANLTTTQAGREYMGWKQRLRPTDASKQSWQHGSALVVRVLRAGSSCIGASDVPRCTSPRADLPAHPDRRCVFLLCDNYASLFLSYASRCVFAKVRPRLHGDYTMCRIHT